MFLWTNNDSHINHLLWIQPSNPTFILTTIHNRKVETAVLLKLDSTDWFEYSSISFPDSIIDKDFFTQNIDEFSLICNSCTTKQANLEFLIPLPKGNSFLKSIYSIIKGW